MTVDFLEIKAEIQIQKPINEVFEVIVNPDKMSNYFISKSSGRMIENSNLIWNFPEFDFDCPVKVGKIIQNEYISFYWDNQERELFVEIKLTNISETDTLITITEKGMPNDLIGLNWLSGNSYGWSNFLACLKAYIEHGINLRKGAFEFMRQSNSCS